MKLVIDEKVKHRIIGIAVILSIAAIFAPAMMKKSNQRFGRNVEMNIQLPDRPAAPQVEVSEKDTVFQSVKVAHVDVNQGKITQPAKELAQAEPIKALPDEALVDEEESAKPLKVAEIKPLGVKKVEKTSSAKQVKATNLKKVKPVVKQKVAVVKKQLPVHKSVIKGPVYSVQLATLSKQENVNQLVTRLKQKGYTPRVAKQKVKNGQLFKIYVGRVNQKEQAIKLRNKLATAVQINGFVVNGVG